MQCSPKRIKIALISVVTVLLLGTVVFVGVYFTLPKSHKESPPALPARLAEVSLDEGETLTYRVDHYTEVETRDVHNGTIRAIVGIRVLNKTAEEYWFLMKLNQSHLRGDVDSRGDKTVTEYFLVRLPVDSSTGKLIEVYGNHSTDQEHLRLVISTTHQVFPTVERKKYEHVDGEKTNGLNSLTPEESPLLPGSVKMHRQANTSDKGTVLIKNHFDRSDFVDMSSEIELDMSYFDVTLINKSNGMVINSQAYLSVHLSFGEVLENKGGINETMMKGTVASHLSLIETERFSIAEFESARILSFVKLEVETATTFPVNKEDREEKSPTVSNSSQTSSNVSWSTGLSNSTNSSATSLRRSRRDYDNGVREIWEKAEAQYLNVEHTIELFEKKVLKIDVKATAEYSVSSDAAGISEIAVRVKLTIGRITLPDEVIKYSRDELQGKATRSVREWNHRIPVISVPVFILTLGVDFVLSFKVSTRLSFPRGGNSLDPVKLTAQIDPSADVTASIEGYISAHVIRAGAYGDGKLMQVALPVTLSYWARRWCVNLSADLTALELSAGIFYQWFSIWHWGTRHTLVKLGDWSAFTRNWNVLEKCAGPSVK